MNGQSSLANTKERADPDGLCGAPSNHGLRPPILALHVAVRASADRDQQDRRIVITWIRGGMRTSAPPESANRTSRSPRPPPMHRWRLHAIRPRTRPRQRAARPTSAALSLGAWRSTRARCRWPKLDPTGSTDELPPMMNRLGRGRALQPQSVHKMIVSSAEIHRRARIALPICSGCDGKF